MRRRERNRTKRRENGEVIPRKPGSRTPFKRALRLMGDIQKIVDKGLQPIERQIEIDALPPYVSRGHGGKHRVRHPLGRTYRDRSKYDPREEDRHHAGLPRV